MDSGLYAAYTGLLARTQALDAAANNLANAGTSGFRAARQSFSGVLVEGLTPTDWGPVADGASQVGGAVNGFGVLGGTSANFGQGPVVATGNPLDLALSGAGFFQIQTKQGIRYTRDGGFMKSPTGVLTTREGEPVLDTGRKQIVLPAGTISVAPDGSVSVTTAAGVAGVVAKLGIVDFALPDLLQAEGANRYVAADGQKALPSTAVVEQGALESSNQDAVHGTMELVLIQRQAEMMQKALTVFDGSLDKAAVEQLARL